MLHYVRQVHSTYKEPREELLQIGRFQLRVLGYLEHHGFRDVFVEGLYKSFDRESPDFEAACGGYHYWLLGEEMRSKLGSSSELCARVRETFSAGDYRVNPSDAQLLLLGELGAYFVYACTSSGVNLHRTVSQLADLELGQRQAEIGDEHDPEAMHLRFEVRERIAMNEIAAFTKKHPGKSIALIYGAMHEMSDAIAWRWRDKRPEMVDVSFPAALEEWNSFKNAQSPPLQ